MPTTTMTDATRAKPSGQKLPSKKSASFHGRIPLPTTDHRSMRRPKTQPDLLAGRRGRMPSSPPEAAVRRVPTKLLVNVTVQRSLGAVQVVASPDWTVGDLIGAAVRQYMREGRRPLLLSADPFAFGLHYSQFSLECLDRAEKLMELGSRNFFLCPTAAAASSPTPLASTCKQADKASSSNNKIATSLPWLKFFGFLL